MTKTKRHEPISTASLSTALGILEGTALGFVCLLLLLFLSAISIHNGYFTQEHINGIVLVTTLLSSLLGCLFTLRTVKKNKLPVGLAVGLLLFLLLLLIGKLCYSSFEWKSDSLEILFASLVGGGMGKIFSGKKKKSH